MVSIVPRAHIRALLRMLGIAALVLWFIAGLGFLLVREVVVPRVADHRAEIALALGDAVGLPVVIEKLSADLSGFRPRLHLSGFEVRDTAGRPALRLEALDATLAWGSLLSGRPVFHRIELRAPELALRREADGEFYVAGIHIDPRGEDAGFADWLLAQREFVIRDARLRWNDALRGAPELRLDAVDVRVLRTGPRWRAGIQATPQAGLARHLDLRADLASAAPKDFGSWRGKAFVEIDEASLGAWRQWMDYPIALDGRGSLRAWVGIEPGAAFSATADVALRDVETKLGEGLPQLSLTRLAGRLGGARTPRGESLNARGLTLETNEGVALQPTDLELEWAGGTGGRLSVNRLDFAALARLASHLPFDEASRRRLAAFAPRGMIDGLNAEWRGALAQPDGWKVRADFRDIGVNPEGALPGLLGISGHVEGDQERGRFRIAGENAAIDLPAVFPEPRLAFSVLRAEGGWSRHEGRLEIGLDNAGFENPDAAGSASGRYWPAAQGAGEIDLVARLTRADSGAVWRYLPRVVNDQTRTWLRHGIVGGRVPDARLRLKGPLDQFPFRDGKSGQFLVTTKVFGARLDYAEGWPSITGIDGEVRFEGPGMRITADRARIFDVALAGVVADVPDLDAPGGQVMNIRGRASGPTADFLRFVAESPVSRRIGGFTDGLRAEGAGSLDLRLVLPLHAMEKSTVKGEYRFAANRVRIVEGLPPLEEAAGIVRFTDHDLAIPEANARLYGEPMRLTAATAPDGGVDFIAEGGARLQSAREFHDWPLLLHASGGAQWRARIGARTGGTRVVVDSDLLGVTSSLPAPLNKSAMASWPLKVTLDFPAGGGREFLQVQLDGRAEARIEREPGADGWIVARGGVGLGRAAPDSRSGVTLAADLASLDVDAWRRAFDLVRGGAEQAPGGAGGHLTAIDLKAGEVLAFGQSLGEVHLTARTTPAGWRGAIASREAEGEFQWEQAGDGTLRARLRRLTLAGEETPPDSAEPPVAANGADEAPPTRLPALDCVVERFALRGLELGKLELQARNSGGVWHLDTVRLENPDGKLNGSGQWRQGGRSQTDLDFRLETQRIGELARRLGYGEVIRGGQAVLAGRLSWRGAPTRIDYPSLGGTMMLEAEDGQFRKIDPGMGRLLGVLSLQSLPRRLTLDFRDIFSEGFAFDTISGSIKAASGEMRTDGLQIRGPSARIHMSGSVDLEQETQDLRVTVQPTLSESVAVGAAAGLINPVAGVVAYVAQKALSDPIEKFFSFDYAITGAWADPRVEKLSGAAPAVPAKSKE